MQMLVAQILRYRGNRRSESSKGASVGVAIEVDIVAVDTDIICEKVLSWFLNSMTESGTRNSGTKVSVTLRCVSRIPVDMT